MHIAIERLKLDELRLKDDYRLNMFAEK